MKKLIGMIAILGIGFCANAHSVKNLGSTVSKILKKDKEEKGIQFFHGSWIDALKKSKEENKLIFLDAYASWCGPCKLMAKNTFTEKEVGDYFNANFINVKMDMEKNENGPRLSDKYRLTAYPTLFFIDSKEEVFHQEIGYLKPNQLMTVAKKVSEQKGN